MKKQLYFFLFTTLISVATYGQNWIVYEADVLPDAASPAWSESNTKDLEYSWEIVDDPAVEGNKLLKFESLVEGGGAMWKTSDFDPVPTAVTAVMRTKLDGTADRVNEIDMHVGGFRDQLIIRASNEISLQRSDTTLAVPGLDVTKWNVFRMTMDASSGTGGIVNIYLNEDPTPVLTMTTTTTTGDNYYRFGDGNSSPTYASLTDFVAHDISGAYDPSELSLPEGLIPSEENTGSWVVYEADVLPDAASPAWSESNTKDLEYSWEIVDDPAVEGNKLLKFESLVEGGGAMWKTGDFDPVPTAVTAVMRTKLDGTADRVNEIDMHVGGFRDQLIIRATNEISLQRSDTTLAVPGLDVTEWNVFRMTMDASSGTGGIVNIYLNEDPTPVLTMTTTTTTGDNYYRFGDGNSSPTYASLTDFVAHDITGAYDPSELSLPEGLIPEEVIPVGDWTIYEADELPDAATPSWSESNTKDLEYSWTVVDDPVIEGNKLLQFESLVAGGGAMWKTGDFNPVPDAVTVTFRTKLFGAEAERVNEMDMHVNGFRDQLIIRANNEISLQRTDTTLAIPGLDVTQWNVFRITLDASSGTEGIVNVYLNGDPTPVLTMTTTQTTGDNYIRFGDGNSSPTYASLTDFVTYDTTGAYAPDETVLPDGLIPETPVGDWTIYDASVLPDQATPPWSESNTKALEYSWTIVDDPDSTGNKLLDLKSLIDGGGAMWKTEDFDPVPDAVTVAFRTKLKEGTDAERVNEMDMHVNGFRDQLIIRASNEISLQRTDTTLAVPGLDVTKWNVFRMTVDASSGTEGIVNVYLNENPSPVLTMTTTQTTGDNYIRFGDGNSSPTYASYTDFVVYDTTGGFSPAERVLPPGLLPGTGEESSEDAAYLSDLTIDGTTVSGFFQSTFEYNVELSAGTTEVPTVAATPVHAGATVEITNATSLPGATTVSVSGAGGANQVYTVNFTVAPNTDATLSGVQVDGTAVADFDPETTFYEVGIPSGTTTVPAITATTTDPNATYTVTGPEELPGAAVIDVTAEDGSTTMSYRINLVYELSSDAALADLLVSETTITGFDPEVLEYDMELNTLSVPGIIAITNHPSALAFVTYPNELPGTATISVTAEDGETTRVYTVDFTTTAEVLSVKGLTQMNIYPNPVGNTLQIHNATKVTDVHIYSTSGQMIGSYSYQNMDLIQLDVTEFEQGIYFVKAVFKDASVIQLKMIK